MEPKTKRKIKKKYVANFYVWSILLYGYEI